MSDAMKPDGRERGGMPLTVSSPALLGSDGDTDFRKLIHGIVNYAGSVFSVRDCFAAHAGITGPQYEIMMLLMRRQSGSLYTISDIASHIGKTSPFVTSEVKKLEIRGYIVKILSEYDKRKVFVDISKDADALLRNLSPIQIKLNDKLFEGVTKKEFDVLGRVYAKLVANGLNAAQLAAEEMPHRAPVGALLRGDDSRAVASAAKE